LRKRGAVQSSVPLSTILRERVQQRLLKLGRLLERRGVTEVNEAELAQGTEI
jgi:hypothetical protein